MDVIHAHLSAGRSLLADTKQKKPVPPAGAKKGPATDFSAVIETDPFKIFVGKCVSEKRKKADIIEDIKQFIKVAEDAL